MIASRRSLLRLSLPALVILATTSLYAQESLMLRSNHSPVSAAAINRGDFNGDGLLDVVIAGVSNNAISVFPGRADGTFAPPISMALSHQPNDLAVGDFNNDGKLDVAITFIDTNAVQILLGNGDGTFTVGDTILLDQVPASVTTSDFNNDGKMDLAVGIGVTTNQGVTTNEIEILQGDGAGHFNRVNTLGFASSTDLIIKVRVGDFNADGNADIAVLTQGGITVESGLGNFNFGADFIKGYAQTNDMNTGDVNQDGFTDILVSWADAPGSLNGGVDVLYGSVGEGDFTIKAQIPAGGSLYESPRQMIAADVNGDGINDIVALDNDSTSANGLYVWLGNADGTFQQTPTKFIYTTDFDKTALVAGDFNRDGKIDFAVGLSSNFLMEVLLNATPRASCQKNTANPSMTVCQPQEATFSNSPLHIIAEGNDSKGVSDIDVFIDNVKKGSFAASSIDKFFSLPTGDHFVVVKGFDPTGASFRSDRHVAIFSGAPGETCPSSSSTALSVNVCLPAQNATLISPVQIFANSYSPRPVTAIQVYIDNQLAFNDQTATEVNKLFSMSPGMHFIVVKAFDATGNSVSESRTITVK
jgi:hypothetical protein